MEERRVTADPRTQRSASAAAKEDPAELACRVVNVARAAERPRRDPGARALVLLDNIAAKLARLIAAEAGS